MYSFCTLTLYITIHSFPLPIASGTHHSILWVYKFDYFGWCNVSGILHRLPCDWLLTLSRHPPALPSLSHFWNFHLFEGWTILHYIIYFVHHGHSGCLHILAVENASILSLQNTCANQLLECWSLFKVLVSVLLDKDPGVDLLDQTVDLFLISCSSSTVFSRVTALFASPLTVYKNSLPPTLISFSSFYFR